MPAKTHLILILLPWTLGGCGTTGYEDADVKTNAFHSASPQETDAEKTRVRVRDLEDSVVGVAGEQEGSVMGRLEALEGKMAAQERIIEAAEALLGKVVINDEGDVEFIGANVIIKNGQDATATTNGKGNLIIGYNEACHGAECTGSHNLVLGDEHIYTSYGAIVSGR